MNLMRVSLLVVLSIFIVEVNAAESTKEAGQGEQNNQQDQLTSSSQTVSAPANPSKPKVFYGGGIGLGFGTVDYVQIWPLIGINITPKLAAGIRLFYQYTKDSRYSQTVTTNDFGGTLFARYFVTKPVFLQAEYEYLNYEYPSDFDLATGNITTDRTGLSSFLGGAGVRQIVGRNTSIYAVFLYNFTYEESDRAYDSPWVIRFGVGIGM